MFESLSAKFAGAFSSLRSKGRLKGGDIEEITAEIHTALIDSDVNIDGANNFVSSITNEVNGKLEEINKGTNPAQAVFNIVNDELVKI